MNEYMLVELKECNQILEIVDNNIVYWPLKPEYIDLCENCILFDIDESYGEEVYQQVKDTCPYCIDGSKFEYFSDTAPLSEDEIEEYLKIGDFNGFSCYSKINIDDIINNPLLYINNITDDKNIKIYYIGKFPSIIEARAEIMMNNDL